VWCTWRLSILCPFSSLGLLGVRVVGTFFLSVFVGCWLVSCCCMQFVWWIPIHFVVVSGWVGVDLLNMGLQYNLHKPSATNWTKLAIETEQAIRLLDDSLQGTFRITAAKKRKQISNNNPSNLIHKRQTHILKSIKQKIHNNNAMITRADKGKNHCYHTYTRLQWQYF